MNRFSPNIWLVLAALSGIAYPFIVYSTMGLLPLWTFLLIGLAAIGLRLYGMRSTLDLRLCCSGLLALMIILGVLYMKNELHAVQAYPVIVSLIFASIFGLSLMFPPTVVERIARLSEPDLSASGVVYTRRVTWVWFVFLLVNAALALGTIFWGTIIQWTLWTGFLSYVCMGTLFAAEYVVRKFVRT